jgi:hypothetical protein
MRGQQLCPVNKVYTSPLAKADIPALNQIVLRSTLFLFPTISGIDNIYKGNTLHLKCKLGILMGADLLYNTLMRNDEGALEGSTKVPLSPDLYPP